MALNQKQREIVSALQLKAETDLPKQGTRHARRVDEKDEIMPYEFQCSFSNKTKTIGTAHGKTPGEAIEKAMAKIGSSRPSRIFLQTGFSDDSTPGMAVFTHLMFSDPYLRADL